MTHGSVGPYVSIAKLPTHPGTSKFEYGPLDTLPIVGMDVRVLGVERRRGFSRGESIDPEEVLGPESAIGRSPLPSPESAQLFRPFVHEFPTGRPGEAKPSLGHVSNPGNQVRLVIVGARKTQLGGEFTSVRAIRD